jgi:cellulose synthase/poly-beta-1,6-N-acetylglucosamine synthase-like glycosyltransferase
MIVSLFWIAAAVVVYAYVGYPLWMYLLSHARPRKWRQGEMYPSVSIIVAVHNGAKLLRDKINHLLNVDYPQELVELLIVSDGSTDATNEILGCVTDPRLISIICPEHRGKANALNHAITRAKGDILVFVDIRPKLEKPALRQIVSNFADPTIGCVAGELCLRIADHDAGTKAVSGLYWRYEQGIRKCEAMVDSPVGVYGGFYAVRRTLATTIPSGLILDDMYQPLSIVRAGYRSVIDDRARVWDIWPKTSSAEFQRKVRTLAGNYQLVQKAPWLLKPGNRLRFELISHKLLRLAVPFLLLFLLLASCVLRATQPYTAILIAEAVFYGLAVLGLVFDTRLLRRIAAPASALVLMNAAAVVALFMFVFRSDSLLGLWVIPEPQPEERTARAA